MMETDPFMNGTKADITIDDLETEHVAPSSDVERREVFMQANGSSYLYSEKSNKDTQVKFQVNADGKYEVRYFVPKVKKRVILPDSLNIDIEVGDVKVSKTIPVNDRRGKFVLIGTYDFQKNQPASLTAKPLVIGDPLIADAILMVSAK